MLTDRDKDILRWIESYKSLTINQAVKMYFKNNYSGASRRLKQLEDQGLIKSFNSQIRNEKVYIFDKKVSDHNLYILDYIAWLVEKGAELKDINLNPSFFNGLLKPDAYVSFKYDGYIFFTLLEVDYTHYTDNSKFQLYEKLFNEELLKEQCKGEFPIIVVSRPTKGIRYNSKNFEVLYTDLLYKDLEKFLFE